MINRGLIGCELSTLSNNEAVVLFTLTVMEEQGIKDHVKERFNLDPGYNIIRSRLEALGFSASPCLIAFLSFISNGIPGRMVMWSYTLACLNSELNKTVTMSEWLGYFCDGIPTDAAYNSVWESQKIKRKTDSSPDNAYDVAEYWPKLMEKTQP